MREHEQSFILKKFKRVFDGRICDQVIRHEERPLTDIRSLNIQRPLCLAIKVMMIEFADWKFYDLHPF